MVALHDHAQLLQVDTELLREGLRGARRQLQALQRQLSRMQREAGRQQTLAETLLMEKECEVRRAMGGGGRCIAVLWKEGRGSRFGHSEGRWQGAMRVHVG